MSGSGRGRGRRGGSRETSNVTSARAAVPVPVPEHQRPYHGVGTRPIRAGATVECQCWCEATTLRVPVGDVSRGVTGSCGRPGCAAP